MPPKPQKSKAAKMLAAQSGSKSRGNRKKWSKGKVRDKKNFDVVVDSAYLDKMVRDLPKRKVITIATVADQFRVSGSVARRVIRQLAEQGTIREVIRDSSMLIYTKM